MSNGYHIAVVIFVALCLMGCTPRPAEDDTAAVSRRVVAFEGELEQGRTFVRGFGDRFTFFLRPIPHGWIIEVQDERGTEDISRLTPPWHFVPNPRYLEGWHFRNSDNTGPNAAGEKNVNAPGEIRSFIFSPEVGGTIDGPHAGREPTYEEVQRVEQFGRGTLTITEHRLNNLVPGQQAGFDWIRFRVEMSWSR